jgi:CO/xanthine dehydrogenase FAD-binding subunit
MHASTTASPGRRKLGCLDSLRHPAAYFLPVPRQEAVTTYRRPRHLDEALALLAAGRHLVLAGGTDIYPASVGRSLEGPILDISGVTELAGIDETEAGWRIGARVTWSELARQPLPPLFDGLKAAGREVGGVQIQNRATLAGNLCNASPAADGAPCLLAMDAEVELASAEGRRRLRLDAFLLGNRHTALRPDELVTAILVPRRRGRTRSSFLKLGSRRYLVISIVMVAFVVELDGGGRVARAGIAVGACASTARRLAALERRLVGHTPEDLASLVSADDASALAPIDDIRGSAAYRRDAVQTLLRRGLAA